jgi:hypothetical protein
LNRSANRRSGASVAHRYSLVWIPSTRAAACSAVGHDAPIFTGDLLAFQPPTADLLPPLAMWTAFPPSGYYGGSVPPGDHQPTTSPPATGLAGWREGRSPGGSHVHHGTGRRPRRPAIPRQPRHEYAAALPRGLPVSRTTADPGVASSLNEQGVHC